MSWYNRTIQGYELECMVKVNTLLSHIARELTSEEWTTMLKDIIPEYLLPSALEYALKEQMDKDTHPNIVAVTSAQTKSR